MGWRETPDSNCCQTLYRDDGKALGYIGRFYGAPRRRAGVRGGRFTRRGRTPGVSPLFGPTAP
jgi:hypothetical protein